MLQNLETIILDPLSEDAANVPLELTGRDAGAGIYLESHSYPKAEKKTLWAGSADSRGERRANIGQPSNRRIPVKVWVAEESALGLATNLIANPSFETNTTDWSAGGAGVTIARVQSQRRVGESSLEVIVPATTFSATYCLPPATLTPSRTYTFAAKVRAPLGHAMTIGLAEWTTGYGAQVGATTLTSFVGTGDWQIVGVSKAFGGTGTRAQLFVYHDAASVATFHVDGALLYDSTGITNQPLDYWDGDTPGCEWTGTAHASTSTRRAAGGKRFIASLADLEQKVEKMAREGGTYKRYLPSGDFLIFDVLEASIDGATDKPFNQAKQSVELEFVVDPNPRGPEVIGTDKAETSLPVVIQTETTIGGAVPARGRLLIDDDQAVDRHFLIWGMRSRYYAASADAALFYEAEGRTVLAGSTVVTGNAPASGAGSNNVVRQTVLSPTAIAILSTQATGGGNHLRHVGTYRIFARVYRPTTNTGSVSVALEWAEGDYRKFRQNDWWTWDPDDREGAYTLADLGVVRLQKATAGTQRWEGRVLAKSTVVGDDIDIDCLTLIPVDEGWGMIRGRPVVASATSALVGFDDFNNAAYTGTLVGEVAPLGGTWSGSGDSDPFTQDTTNLWTQRSTAAADAAIDTGHYARLGTATPAGIDIQADFNLPATNSSSFSAQIRTGVFARYVDTSNYLLAAYEIRGTAYIGNKRRIVLIKRVAGTVTILAATPWASSSGGTGGWRTLRLVADAAGRASVYDAVQGGDFGAAVLTATDTVLATSGTLDDGGFGIADASLIASTSYVRKVDNLSVGAPSTTETPVDPAIFASQSCEVRHDRVLREDSGGTLWVPVGDYEGDYCAPSPASREKRTLQWIVLTSRGDPAISTDPAIDDTSGRLYWSPLYDVVPDPT